MNDVFATLEIVRNGELTVVGFGGRELLDQVNLAACREQIIELVKRNQTKTLAFDMTGVRLIPSGLLGLLASLRDIVGKIQILNPSTDVREALEVTKLNQIFEVSEITP
ncbi:MAG: anti-sigma factor antagonist [Planctomycetaceae bacterium]|nr:anti-sigma factor antagonist [Planctomycetaceae bacterium]